MTKSPAKFAAGSCPTCGSPRTIVNPAWLRWRRESADLSLRDLGARLDFSAVYLSDIERGRRNCTPKIRAAYEALGAR
jgi:hypothetical protein